MTKNTEITNEAVPQQELPQNVDEKKKKKKRKKRRKKKHPILKALLILILLAILAVCIYVGYVVLSAPSIDTKNLYQQLNTTSMLYDDEGNEMEAISTADARTLISYDEVPDNLANAFIAIEDKTFYEHNGFNIVRILGAIKNSITSGGRVSGTSTITQQLARNLYLSSERSIERKIKEAYYTLILEDELTKEQILEAYLNTIYLGYNTSGVQAAAKAYFGVELDELTLAECATLAAIPKSPNKNAPLKKVEIDSISADDESIVAESSDGEYVSVYNDGYIERQQLVLTNMLEQGLITQAEYDEASQEDIREDLNPTEPLQATVASYFADYCIDEVTQDLMEKYNITQETASNMVYNKGLKIYTTIDVEMQEIAEEQFEINSNFPSVTALRRDSSRNILNSKTKNILLYYKDNYLNSDGSFTLSSDEYEISSSGNLVILKDQRLSISKSGDGTPNIALKDIYEMQNGRLYTIEGGYFRGLTSESLSFDSDGNAIVFSSFLEKNPDYFTEDDKGGLTIAADNVKLSQSTIQPQGSIVITDYTNGQVKVMVGGRGGLEGKRLYNRANQPRQPGSSIKPIAVYGPAIQSGVDKGTVYTAGSTVEDAPTKSGWPKNWYSGYRGYVTLRTAVEQSMNIVSVKIVNNLGYDYSVESLKKNGVTTIVEEGEDTDLNPSSLGLGGMLKGISPLQMASAYGTFPNKGIHVDPTTYTKVEDAQGNVILESEPAETRVFDEGVAWIMTDILRTTVTRGIAGRASIGVQPVGGKTGTTSDNYDAWFVGVTPQYAAAVWIGNDVNIQLSQGSNAAATLWSRVMRRVSSGLEYGSFGSMPDDVYRSGGEYFVRGTKAHGKTASYKSGDEKKKKTTTTTTTNNNTTSTTTTQTDGTNSTSTNGTTGTNGTAGTNGSSGTNGTSGTNASNGTNGANGVVDDNDDDDQQNQQNQQNQQTQQNR